jgi:hypothetical protein
LHDVSLYVTDPIRAVEPASRSPTREAIAPMTDPIREVDPAEVRVPPSRSGGADAWKLHQQIRRFGSSKAGMPPILVHEDPDGILEITDGVTRATRIAKLNSGETVPAIVIGRYRRSRASSPRVRDVL